MSNNATPPPNRFNPSNPFHGLQESINALLTAVKGGNLGQNQNPNKKPQRQADSFGDFVKFTAKIGTLGKALQTLKDLDDLQVKSLKTGTNVNSVAENNKVINSLKASNLDLIAELLDFREEGIKRLDDSTLDLVSRMKLTDQSTAGLKKLLGQNSMVMMLSYRGQSELVQSLDKSAKTYGMSQERLIQVVNGIAKSTETFAAAGGNAGKATAAFGEYVAMYGAKSEQQVNEIASFLGDANELATKSRLGITDALKGLGKADDLKKLISKVGNTLERFRGSGSDMDMAAFQAQVEGLGLTMSQATAFLQLNANQLKESTEVNKQWADVTQSFKAFIVAVLKPIEAGFLKIYGYFNSMEPEIKKFAQSAATIATILGAGSVLIRMLSFLKVFTPGGALLTGLSLLFPALNLLKDKAAETAENTKEVADNTKEKIEQIQATSSDYLFDTLNNTLYSVLSNSNMGDEHLRSLDKLNTTMERVYSTLQMDKNIPTKASR